MIEQFKQADLNVRMEMVNQFGEYLVSRDYYRHKHNLYALPGFYVEVVYDPDDNSITDVRVVDDLNKYLPFIDLNIS
jgi:hypothetical protein